MRLQPIILFAQVLSIVRALPPAPSDGTPSDGKWPVHSPTKSPPKSSHVPTTPCSGNTPNDRSSWCNSNISTDYEATIPHTGVVREYWLYVNDLYLQPDGYHNRSVITVNNTIPGPTLFADWGDEVVVHVKNNLTSRIKNGTSIHFHGVRQHFTNQMDGVVSLTQCPIAPGSSMTYRWRATQYGSSWYHSHIGLQAWEGVSGGMIVNGPASANYDEDMGVLFLNDWTYETPDELFFQERQGNNPDIPSGLMNGTTVSNDANGHVTGRRFVAKVMEGKSYRFRIVNAAINSHFEFKIDNHNLTVIAMDFVPIKPYETDSVVLGMGQRYDVIVYANKASLGDSFWIQAISKICSGNPNMRIHGILQYGKVPTLPKVEPQDSNRLTCDDEPLNLLHPYVEKNVGSLAEAAWNKTITSALYQPNSSTGFYSWYLNHTSMQVNWTDPTLAKVYHRKNLKPTLGPYTNQTWVNTSNLIELPMKDEWVYINIISEIGVDPESHPIHLHGHDFYILAQGNGTFNGVINTQNPPRRDTALLPSMGHLIVAFKTDNPGAWLMHCHIGWHNAEGFALQFLERRAEIRNLIDYRKLSQTCRAWDAYAVADGVNEELEYDSGV